MINHKFKEIEIKFKGKINQREKEQNRLLSKLEKKILAGDNFYITEKQRRILKKQHRKSGKLSRTKAVNEVKSKVKRRKRNFEVYLDQSRSISFGKRAGSGLKQRSRPVSSVVKSRTATIVRPLNTNEIKLSIDTFKGLDKHDERMATLNVNFTF